MSNVHCVLKKVLILLAIMPQHASVVGMLSIAITGFGTSWPSPVAMPILVSKNHNLTPDHSNTHPADILIPHWYMGKPAALDLSVTSPLNPLTRLEAGVTAGAAAKATEERNLKPTPASVQIWVGYVSLLLRSPSYGAWGLTARDFFSNLGSRLATSLGKSKSVVIHELYGRLSMNLAGPMPPRSCPGPYLLQSFSRLATCFVRIMCHVSVSCIYMLLLYQ